MYLMNYLISKKTKIVATIGPSSQDKETLKKLIANGMTCMRLNFSHGSHEEHLKKINTLRETEREEGVIIPIALDTKGPEIRTGCFKGGFADFKRGTKVTIKMKADELGDNTCFGVTYPNLFEDAIENTVLRLDDGNLELLIVEKNKKDRTLICEVRNDHVCKDRRGVNCPQAHLTMPYLSKQDIDDLVFGCQQHVDFVFASFVRNANDIKDIRTLIDSNGGKNISIISKIENTEAIENLESVIRESDGVMVARGDLGIEIPAELVPVYQKKIIHLCRHYGKPVITATQMLDSMIRNPIPTRAEVSDVAWAIEEGTDAVMLSGESANGIYPAESVQMQSRIALAIEKQFDYDESRSTAFRNSDKTISDAIANAVSETAAIIDAKMILTISSSGATAMRIARTRPVCPTFVVSNEIDTLKHVMLYYGCYPYHVKTLPQFAEEMEVLAIKISKDYNLNVGDRIIVTGGTLIGSGNTNFMKVITVPSKDKYISRKED